MAKIDTKKFILNLFSLLLLTLVVIVILSIYNILKPNSKNQTYNFTSFPNIGPADLPPGKTSGSNCNISIQECPDGSCAKCGDTTFVCKTLTDKDPPYYFTNKEGVRIPMPTNKPICIPDPNKVASVTDCNTYTGSWLWTTSPGCPNGEECWTCACKYEGLFGDGTKGCNVPYACQQDTIPQNKLVLTPEGAKHLNAKLPVPRYQAGDIYDPINGNDSALLLQNPYDVDENNNPLFSCSCAPMVGGKAQVKTSLPGDPYTCHEDICWLKKDKSAATVSGDTIDCDCTGGVKIGPGGPERTTDKTGLCFPNNFCGAGSDAQGNQCTVGGVLDKTGSKCDCITNFAQRKCNSQFVHWNDSTPACCNTENPIGYECWNNCNPNNCAQWEKCINGVCQCPSVDGGTDMGGNFRKIIGKSDPTLKKCVYGWEDGTQIAELNPNDPKGFLVNSIVDKSRGSCGNCNPPGGLWRDCQCDPFQGGCDTSKDCGKCCASGKFVGNSGGTAFWCQQEGKGNECKGPSCFAPDSLVYLKDGTMKQIRDITKNDTVLTSTKDGKLFYTKLQYDIWFEIKDEDHYWDYVIVETPSYELKVTNDHRLYMANYKSIWDDTKMAKNLRIGDQIYVYKDNEICVESIVKLTHTKLKGKYDCHTEEGHVIVQNILCSCMDSPLPNWFAFWFWKKLQTRPFLYKLIFKYLYSPSINWRKNIPNNPIADELFDNSFFLKRKDF